MMKFASLRRDPAAWLVSLPVRLLVLPTMLLVIVLFGHISFRGFGVTSINEGVLEWVGTFPLRALLFPVALVKLLFGEMR